MLDQLHLTLKPTFKMTAETPITTLIFDVDDTLYDVSTGFTDHRNGEAAQRFMMEYLNFPDLESAKKIRDQYFEKYHATAKALTIAEQDGAFPPPDPTKPTKVPRFDPKDLADYWTSNLDFRLLGGKKIKLLQDLESCGLKLVAFSNGPRRYVKRVLVELGLFNVFGDERLYAVDDVLPFCKPEKEAFEKIFADVGVRADECVMIEDSMKNIKRANELGMKTVLVIGKGRMKNCKRSGAICVEDTGESTNTRDAPDMDDPAVDFVVETVDELRQKIPGLWASPAIFMPTE